VSDAPIVLVADDDFEAGADDYLRKPFSTRELGARVQAIVGRRSEPSGSSRCPTSWSSSSSAR